MNGEERRQQIITVLQESELPVSASKLAKKYDVSRQVIVGDIALLRATGIEIKATSRGYLLAIKNKTHGYEGTLVCEHDASETEEELRLIVSEGGKVLDVTVTHPIYGEISANLEIATQAEVTQFIKQTVSEKAQLLSVLTAGVHTHRIGCDTKEKFEVIKEKLRQANFLYQEK